MSSYGLWRHHADRLTSAGPDECVSPQSDDRARSLMNVCLALPRLVCSVRIMTLRARRTVLMMMLLMYTNFTAMRLGERSRER